VLNPNGKSVGVERMMVNGNEVDSKQIKLEADGAIYEVEVHM